MMWMLGYDFGLHLRKKLIWLHSTDQTAKGQCSNSTTWRRYEQRCGPADFEFQSRAPQREDAAVQFHPALSSQELPHLQVLDEDPLLVSPCHWWWSWGMLSLMTLYADDQSAEGFPHLLWWLDASVPQTVPEGIPNPVIILWETCPHTLCCLVCMCDHVCTRTQVHTKEYIHGVPIQVVQDLLQDLFHMLRVRFSSSMSSQRNWPITFTMHGRFKLPLLIPTHYIGAE